MIDEAKMDCFGNHYSYNSNKSAVYCQLCRRIDDEVHDKCLKKTELNIKLEDVKWNCPYKYYKSDGFEGYYTCKIKFFCSPDVDCLNKDLLKRKMIRKQRKEKLTKVK